MALLYLSRYIFRQAQVKRRTLHLSFAFLAAPHQTGYSYLE